MPDARERFLRHPDEEGGEPKAPALRPPVVEQLVTASLHDALKNRGLRRLEHESGLAVVVEIPAATWSSPTESVLERLCPKAEVVTVLGRRSSGSEFSENKASKALGAGTTVIAVTTSPSTLLPATFLGSTDLRITLSPPSVQALRRIIAAICTGSARSLRPVDVVGLGLHDLAFAIRPGLACAVVERLRRASKEKSTALLAHADAPPIEDLAGYGAAMDWGLEVVEDMSRWRRGETVKLSSCLLAGRPGVGKTHFASSLAKSAGLNLISTSVGRWFATTQGHLGDVVRAAVSDFAKAADAAPCLFHIDEVDALPARTSLSSNGRDWWTSVVTTVLLEVDKIRTSGKPIVLLGTTNYAENVDEALRRPGRFDRTITIDIPEGAELERVFRSVLAGEMVGVSLTPIVRRVRRATGAQVRAWVDAARRLATSESRAMRLDDLIRSALPVEDRPPEVMMAIAIHEAGHAVVALALGSTVTEVSIISDGTAGGATAVTADGLQTMERFEDQIAVMLGGRAADEIVGNGPSAGAVSDLASATAVATSMRASFGFHGLLHLGPEAAEARLAMDRVFADEIEADLQAGLARAKTIVETHRDVVERVAEALVSHKILEPDDLHRIWTTRRRATVRRSKSRRRDDVRSFERE